TTTGCVQGAHHVRAHRLPCRRLRTVRADHADDRRRARAHRRQPARAGLRRVLAERGWRAAGGHHGPAATPELTPALVFAPRRATALRRTMSPPSGDSEEGSAMARLWWLLVIALAGCAEQPVATRLPTQALLHDESFSRPARPVD